MWTLRMMSGLEFKLNDKEATAVSMGAEKKLMINLGYAIINGSSVESITNDKEMAMRSNPIFNDEDFKKYLNGDTTKIDVLNSRYRGEKYEKSWSEAWIMVKEVRDNLALEVNS